MKTLNYVAFLRGINVGKRQVQMTKLKSAFEKMGYSEAKTVLATGNVVFYSGNEDSAALTETVEEGLAKIFGFTVRVILRSTKEMAVLKNSNPFKGIKVTADTRLYVTFLSEPHDSELPIPHVSKDKQFKILSVSDTEVISVLILTPETRTVEVMAIIEKEFGKGVTTRNWNTVERVLEVMG